MTVNHDLDDFQVAESDGRNLTEDWLSAPSSKESVKITSAFYLRRIGS
jgi:hypothetical protein